MKILLIHDRGHIQPAPVEPGASVQLLTFHRDPGVADRLALDFESQGAAVTITSAAGMLDDAALEAREGLADLVANFPAAFPSLMERMTFREELSLWWLHELSGKRSDRQPAFTRLCQLEVVRRMVAGAAFDAIRLLSDDGDFTAVLQEYAARQDIPFESSVRASRPLTGPARWLRVIGSSLTNLGWFGRTAVQALIARIARRLRPGRESPRATTFFCHYPDLWRERAGGHDEKYAGVPDAAGALEGSAPAYLVSFASDGRHQSVTIREFLRHCRWFLRQRDREIDLLDAELRAADLFVALRHVFRVRHFRDVELDPTFVRYWRYHGVSIAPLLRAELWDAARRIPRYLLIALQVQRYVRRRRPRRLVTYLFEFCYGRAILYGARSARVGCDTVGVQHGPFARRKLITHHRPSEVAPADAEEWIRWLPGPHRFVVEGTGARDRLEESGYSRDRIDVAGAPRVKGLKELVRARGEEDRTGDRRVLVAFGQHDAASILAACAELLRRTTGPRLLFKLHPRSGFTVDGLKDTLSRQDIHDGYEILEGSLYDVLAGVDAVVGTYSSVVMEAAALGFPVVCLQTADRVNTSPILDLDPAPGVMVAPPRDLAAALDAALAAGQREASPELWGYFFGPAAEPAEDLWAKAIVGGGPGGEDGATRGIAGPAS